jgi:hypothetical protein
LTLSFAAGECNSLEAAKAAALEMIGKPRGAWTKLCPDRSWVSVSNLPAPFTNTTAGRN